MKFINSFVTIINKKQLFFNIEEIQKKNFNKQFSIEILYDKERITHKNLLKKLQISNQLETIVDKNLINKLKRGSKGNQLSRKTKKRYFFFNLACILGFKMDILCGLNKKNPKKKNKKKKRIDLKYKLKIRGN